MNKHALVRAVLAGVVIVPFVVFAQGTAEDPRNNAPAPSATQDPVIPADMPGAGSSGTAGSAPSSAPVAPADMPSAGTAPAPSGASSNPVSNPDPSNPLIPPSIAPTSTESTMAEATLEPTTSPDLVSAYAGTPSPEIASASYLWLLPLAGALAVIPFGFLIMAIYKRGSVQKDDSGNRCFDIEQMMKDKLKEFTDLKAMAKDKAIDVAKERMREAVAGTPTGDMLIKLEKLESEYMRLKKLFDECKIDIERYRYKGVLIENSLLNKEILNQVRVLHTRTVGSWTLHDIRLSKQQIEDVQKNIADNKWFFHLWEPGKDTVTVVFKDRLFNISHSEKATWKDAIAHGMAQGIPQAQLDFSIV